jgi:hypothetical protein
VKQRFLNGRFFGVVYGVERDCAIAFEHSKGMKASRQEVLLPKGELVMAKGKSNQLEGDDMRRRFRKGLRRQFSPKLPMSDARALIWLAITQELSLTDTIAKLVRDELVRRGKHISGPEFNQPTVTRNEERAAA